MYYEKFVTSLRVDDRFLREENGVVKIPFGTEYSLYLKNLESRDAVVSVSIDGKDILDGNQLIVRGNSSTNLLGFLKNNVVKNKFRFIELTKEIEDLVGYNPEDSIIRIEFTYEKKKQNNYIINTIYNSEPTIYHKDWNYKDWNYTYCDYNNYNVNTTSMGGNSSCCNYSNISESSPRSFDDVGITVYGGDCRQDFYTSYVGDLEDVSHTIVLRLSGYKDNKKVSTFITTKEKIYCPSCGKPNRSSNKFCTNCGGILL